MGLTSHNWGYAMSSNDTNTTSNKQARDGFLVVSSSVWSSLYYELIKSQNDTIATRILSTYLAICCGADATHQRSKWSSGAIYKRVGIAPSASKKAIAWLSEHNYIEIKKEAKKNVSPDYRINFFGNNPKDTNATDNIYIPNGIVSGVNGDESQSPLRILRDHHNPHLLYLFIRLYGFQDKYLDVINPDIVSTAVQGKQNLDATMIYETNKELGGTIRVWGLDNTIDPSINVNIVTEFHDFKRYEDIEDLGSAVGFFAKLMDLGLTRIITHLCNGETTHSGDEIEHLFIPYADDQSEHIETLCNVAASYDEQPLFHELDDYSYVAVLPSNYKKVHYQKFIKMTYRTKLGEVVRRIDDDKQLKQDTDKLMKGIELRELGIID